MAFIEILQHAKGDLTARQVASAVSPILSVRTVEKWLAGDNEPPEWTHAWIFSRLNKARHYRHRSSEEKAIKSPKRTRKKKGQNAQGLP